MLSTHDTLNITSAIIGAVNKIDDWEWLQDVCLEYAHDDFWVAKTAIAAIGDIARIHNIIDINKVIIVFGKITNEQLQPTIAMAYDDIELFVKQ